MKTVVLVQAIGADRAMFRNWLLTDFGPGRLATRPHASRVALQIALPMEPEPPIYDAVIELWSDEPIGETLWACPDLASRASVSIRTSDEIIAKDEGITWPVGETPGISQLSFVAPIASMPREETLRHWSEHIPLARDIHWGMNRYVQDRFAPAADDRPPWFGMAHLHFPNADALRTGLFRSPDDIEAITADVAEFVSEHVTMYAVEHVLKASIRKGWNLWI